MMPVARSTLSADTGRPGATNSCVHAARTQAWPSTACTCRPKPSISGYEGFRLRKCATPRSTCSAEELATIAAQTLSMWTSDASGAGSSRSPRIRIAFRENLLQGGIVPVDVVVEVNESIFQHDDCGVDDQHRNRVREIHLLRRTAVHGGSDTLGSPSGIIAQNPRRQLCRLFQPDTAVAEIPAGLCEEFLSRSVVHVYVVAVRKEKFHQAERVLGSWLLPDEKLSRSKLAQHLARNCSVRNDILPGVHNFKTFLGQIIGILHNVGNQFPSYDGGRHLPVGAEDDVLHGLAKNRSVVVAERFAHHDVHRHADVEIFVIRAKTKLGNICNDGCLLISERQPPPPLQSKLHLPDPAAQRNIQIR